VEDVMKTTAIEGVGEVFAARLREAGISSDSQLLTRAARRRDRALLAETTGLTERQILEWVNHADLMRVHGVGPEYADLLEAAGVDTVPELAQRNPENLYRTIVKVATDKQLVRRPPSEGMVAEWVAEATRLGRTIEY
jgi:predicted flap endonuclease-1-like 5' DNA nuclease